MLKKENLDQGCPNLAGSSSTPDTGFSQGQSNPDRSQVAFQKLQGKKKKKKKTLQERNQGEWVCCSGSFVQVTCFGRQRNDLLGYEENVFFWESFVSNLPGLEGLSCFGRNR